MPPPPPPSKSYLINLSDSDLSSDDDDDNPATTRDLGNQMFRSLARDRDNNFAEEDRIRNATTKDANEKPPGLSAPVREDTPETFTGVEEEDEDGEDEDEEAACTGLPLPSPGTPTTRKTKRNRKKKKNKKRKKQQQQEVQQEGTPEEAGVAASSAAALEGTRRITVQFGAVSVQNFDRCLGTNVVPLDGGWPLGLGDAIPESNNGTISVDEYEAAKHERLLQRWKKHYQSQKEETPSPGSHEDKSHEAELELPTVLETRQWDYKHRLKNPLFGLVIEKERMALLLGEQDLDEVLEQKYQKDREKKAAAAAAAAAANKKSNKKNHQGGGGSPGKQKGKQQKNQQQNQKKQGKKNGSPTTSGGRSSSFGGRTRSSSAGGGGGSFRDAERYNDQFTEYEVHHVRNELETLRNLRSQQEARGCTCRQLHVYIPPPGAGKKAAHRRLNVKMVTDELRKRHALPSKNCTRDELELLLHDLVAKEPCCRDDNCPCVRNGIECQSDVCQCWHASHQANNNGASSCIGEITPQVIRTRCGNKNGMYTVDLGQIAQYREAFLTNSNSSNNNKFTCQPV